MNFGREFFSSRVLSFTYEMHIVRNMNSKCLTFMMALAPFFGDVFQNYIRLDGGRKMRIKL